MIDKWYEMVFSDLFCSLDTLTRSSRARREHSQTQSPSSKTEFCCTKFYLLCFGTTSVFRNDIIAPNVLIADVYFLVQLSN
jgi:hypothetical protein